MVNKLCVYCEHFLITAKEPDHSSLTAGSSETIQCLKSHFYMVSDDIENLTSFRQNIEKGLTCTDFEDFKSYN